MLTRCRFELYLGLLPFGKAFALAARASFFFCSLSRRWLFLEGGSGVALSLLINFLGFGKSCFRRPLFAEPNGRL
jgi:hypothetical protein